MFDFWAGWCGSCYALAPAIEELAKQYDSSVRGKLDVDASFVGVQPRETFEEALNPLRSGEAA